MRQGEGGARQKQERLTGGIYGRIGRRLELTSTRRLPRGACWGGFASTYFYVDQMYTMFYGHLYPRAWCPARQKRICWNWWEWTGAATVHCARAPCQALYRRHPKLVTSTHHSP